MKRLSKQNRVLMSTVFVLMIMVILGITYAAFSQNLNINGSGVVRNSSWNIHFVTSGSHIERESGVDYLKPSNTLSSSVKVLSDPSISNTTIGDYSVSLTTPGDTVVYTFDIINEGDYNAKISDFSLPTPSCSGEDTESNTKVCNKLSYTLKYDNGATVQNNDMIASKETKTFVLTLTYQEFNDATDLPTKDVTINNLGFTIKYVQVDGALVENDGSTPYTYQTYNVGDHLTIHNEGYYVLSNHDTYVTLLKENPLMVDEVNTYGGVGTEHNHVNRYTQYNRETAHNAKGYGIMAYYSSATCGYQNGYLDTSGCTTDYALSDIKYVVDAWMNDKFNTNELAIDTNGYKARLITIAELENLGFVYSDIEQGFSALGYYPYNANVPTWIYNSNYTYWTMSKYDIAPYPNVWYVDAGGVVDDLSISSPDLAVRPVINVYKSKI